jgi:hypothetical protein
MIKRELTETGSSLDEARTTIAQLKSQVRKDEDQANFDISDLEARNKELELTLGTKNAIIED